VKKVLAQRIRREIEREREGMTSKLKKKLGNGINLEKLDKCRMCELFPLQLK
jgi:hypothetical protein